MSPEPTPSTSDSGRAGARPPRGSASLRSAARSLGLAVVALLLAVLLRKYALAALENRIVWVTFYPAVVVTALFGGWLAGFLTAVGSCFVTVVAWRFFVARPFIADQADWLGLGAFLFNCVLIVAVAEVARRERLRAIAARDQAEAANRAKSAFLASMSHELRTPLNAILGFSRLLRMDPAATAEQRETLAIVNRSGEHLLALINNVLDMAKIESGRASVQSDTCDLPALMQDLTDLMRQSAAASGLALELDLPADLPRFVGTDESKLRQMTLNLLGNAIKFTKAGRVTLRVRAGPPDAAQRRRLAIVVADTGCGIDARDQQRIFEPFVQLGQGALHQGTGLGLTITRQFAELLGGGVRVASEPGRGSEFSLEIMVAAVDAPAELRARASTQRLARLAPGQPEFRILIVEDQPENTLLLRRLLEQAGCVVRVADNGAAGVEIFRTWHPHFIWMDWRMPVMDGIEATRRIRELPGGRAVKIVALSASVFVEERARVLAAGADDFVAKPLQFDQIYDCLARQLGLRFEYEAGEAAEIGREPAALDRRALAALPAELRQDLCGSLLSLDAGRISRCIDQVGQQDPVLGAALAERAARLQYSVIHYALQAEGAAELAAAENHRVGGAA